MQGIVTCQGKGVPAPLWDLPHTVRTSHTSSQKEEVVHEVRKAKRLLHLHRLTSAQSEGKGDPKLYLTPPSSKRNAFLVHLEICILGFL